MDEELERIGENYREDLERIERDYRQNTTLQGLGTRNLLVLLSQQRFLNELNSTSQRSHKANEY